MWLGDWALVNKVTGEVHDMPSTFPEKTLMVDYDTVKKKRRTPAMFKKLMSAFTMIGIGITQRDTRPTLESGEPNPNMLSDKACTFMWKMQSYINYDCIPTYQGVTMKLSDISDLMGWSRPTFTTILAELVEKDYIKRFKDGAHHYIMLNPRAVYRGHSIAYRDVIKRYNKIE